MDGFQAQPSQEPDGSIVQPDEALHVPAGVAVVPGADADEELKRPACQVLQGPEAQHVNASTQRPRPSAEGVVCGFVQGCDEAIDGKHPQIGGASKLPVSLLTAELSLRRGPDDLAAPAKRSVDDEPKDHVALSFTGPALSDGHAPQNLALGFFAKTTDRERFFEATSASISRMSKPSPEVPTP